MKRLRNIFFAGLATVLPVAITMYLIYWLSTTSEAVLGDILKTVLPDHWYRPGLGVVTGLIVVLLVGLMVRTYAVRWFIKQGEKLLARVPLVKTIYAAVKDFTRFLPSNTARRDLQRVVMWQLNGAYIVGFVTSEQLPEALITASSQRVDLVAVYFPLSYQIGGHTLFVPRSELIETTLRVEEALRLVLTGGITTVPKQDEELQDDRSR
ncbi:MAG TPA: DUF502 domain-containing protein [Steroidobacteraceae bacterium]|nr:DUF502 domain-containing protein [Steroidobacteraceae bacterium]